MITLSIKWLNGRNKNTLKTRKLKKFNVEWEIRGIISVDVDETFSLVVKPGTIWIVLSLAASRHWPIHQLDVKNAFLHGELSETVYMHQPLGFWDFAHPDYVCLLRQSLYGLKQPHRAWFQHFASYITRVGFHHSRCDSSLLIYRHGMDNAYLLLFVDDILTEVMILSLLSREFSDESFKCRTPVDTDSKLGLDRDPVSDPTLYCNLACPLQYHTFTHPDISYAVQQLFSSSTTDLVAFSDADWAGFPTTQRSTSGYCVFLGNNLLSWSSKRQPMLSRSSAEAKYRVVANAVVETCWLRNPLRELHMPFSSATLVYCDNVSALYFSSIPVQHQRMKHIEIDIQFV
ncbi:ribonuclease H-like domain-containing protein [Tanacetum coccineum]